MSGVNWLICAGSNSAETPEKSQLSQQSGILLAPVRWRLGSLFVLNAQTLDLLQDFSATGTNTHAREQFWVTKCKRRSAKYCINKGSRMGFKLRSWRSFYLKVNFSFWRGIERDKQKWSAPLNQSLLTCFCSRARQWAAAAVCWHRESRGGLWGPSAAEPVGETKQETWCQLALPVADLILSLLSHISQKQQNSRVTSHPWTPREQSINWHTCLVRNDHHHL